MKTTKNTIQNLSAAQTKKIRRLLAEVKSLPAEQQLMVLPPSMLRIRKTFTTV